MQKPNVIIIKTDQQRADTIASLGNSHMITPNMDKLVSEGVSFTKSFCCGATCIASRAAFYTGMFAHNTGVYSFDQWAHHRTWLHDIKDAGYHLSAVGKVHHSPAADYMAYDERIYAENFPEFVDYDDYSNYLKAEGLPHPNKLLVEDGKWLDKCCSSEFPFEEKHHVDNFVGRMASRWIDEYDKEKPFLLHIGFVGPHDPFTPSKRFVDMYKDVDVPKAIPRGDAFETKPPQYRRFMEELIMEERFDQHPIYGTSLVRIDDKSEEEIADMRRHYYARVTQIDEQIGYIYDMLEKKGLLDNTIILFTSDHGENLGDHGMMYKWLMTEQATKVPMIVRLPGAQRAGAIDEDLFSHIDVGPTILDMLGLEVPCYLDGQSNAKRILNEDQTNVPEAVYCEDNYLTMMRSENSKLIHYAGQKYGEYYDLVNDPEEKVNLYDNNEHLEDVNALKLEMFEWKSVSCYLGSAIRVGYGPSPKRYWPEYHPEDPYNIAGKSSPDRKRIL